MKQRELENLKVTNNNLSKEEEQKLQIFERYQLGFMMIIQKNAGGTKWKKQDRENTAVIKITS